MRLTATDDDAGLRLDAFLAPRLGSRSAAVRAIASGRVTVDGRTAKKSHLLEGGAVVEVAGAPLPDVPAESVEAPPIPVAYSDEWVLIVDKPAGLVSHPAPGHPAGTVSQIMDRFTGGGEEGRRGLVHRLDRNTSGLMILTRTEAAHRRFRDLIDRREVTRLYTALVAGHPPTTEGTVDAPIGRDRHYRTRVSTDTESPREAITHFRVIESLPQSTLLEIRLETGRTHQIRAHLEAIGLPILGDPEYGPAGPPKYGLDRQFLHATRLEFEHPFTEKRVSVASPLPEDLAVALSLARQG